MPSIRYVWLLDNKVVKCAKSLGTPAMHCQSMAVSEEEDDEGAEDYKV
jgi:hypothetical protein